MSKGHTLQDPYLNALRKERVPVSIYLVNGIKLQGQIESFDQFVVLLKNTCGAGSAPVRGGGAGLKPHRIRRTGGVCWWKSSGRSVGFASCAARENLRGRG